jgi:hypothetical protein
VVIIHVAAVPVVHMMAVPLYWWCRANVYHGANQAAVPRQPAPYRDLHDDPSFGWEVNIFDLAKNAGTRPEQIKRYAFVLALGTDGGISPLDFQKPVTK